LLGLAWDSGAVTTGESLSVESKIERRAENSKGGGGKVSSIKESSREQ
jgi:hypothetical protein